ncbi:concanavalin A-like lectin/glucanase [Westerdykella ornata]|uniref:Concanavalin A-like lectin/glucanase n=1 Tax=Westerdykella ornata TaxID=318751 RepID=A0A6A6J601_WESOR|nr:concanavalin A-like lectin/glucanase [Westerdykella ornata]KAF2271563.1 concanavalin A-like lectin/glucanase [Westerdykella ornata]
MLATSHTLRAIACAAAMMLPMARAQYVIDNLSFGHKDGENISPNLRGVPHFFATGTDYTPEILSDRIVLTPPWPGQKRGALWSEDPLHHSGDWSAELWFRASGMERGGGNLQLWYTKEPQKHEAHSLYTAPKFDGLVLVIDQYEGRGGSIRGFLNDGTIDIKSQPDPDTLAFGQCNYPYRNLGRFSDLRVHQTNGAFEVTIDGHICFSTDKVRLPEGYHFGISASSAENPDSFEVHKFVVSTKNAYTREEPKKQPYMDDRHAQSQQQTQHNPHQQQQPIKSNSDPTLGEIPQMLSDVLAGSIRSQADQFADLHNRIQIINHRVNDIYDLLQRMDQDSQNRFNDLMHRIVPIEDRTRVMHLIIENIDRTTRETERDLQSKDFKDVLNTVHNAIHDTHQSLSASMPIAMAHSKFPHSWDSPWW